MMNSTKTLTRLYTDADLAENAPCALGSGPAHKLRVVLRAEIGDEILLFNGRDGEWRARLTDIGKSQAHAQCLMQTRPQTAENGPWLAFAPIKKDPLDMLIEKAVELGVAKLIPVITRRTENRRLKEERLSQQIIDACEQCERLTIPTLEPPITLEQLSAWWPRERKLIVCAERRDAPPLAHAVQAINGPVGLLVGPEGGFTDGELDAVLKQPISIAVNLGPRILRAETAAIAALAVIQATCGDWSTKR
ncbi:MAG: 16S rRNA (uracil(1498)-N(3))-methyltransferase [Rhodospirillales bacterium]|nr:16S rRNA (uracil(1498)-N(3))-methyltransferase [Rhodospirillales bacterium]